MGTQHANMARQSAACSLEFEMPRRAARVLGVRPVRARPSGRTGRLGSRRHSSAVSGRAVNSTKTPNHR